MQDFILYPRKPLGRLTTLTIQSVMDFKGGVEILVKMTNGFLPPNTIAEKLNAFNRKIGLDAKLKGVRSTFQFLRPRANDEDSILGRAFRITFNAYRREDVSFPQLKKYLRHLKLAEFLY